MRSWPLLLLTLLAVFASGPAHAARVAGHVPHPSDEAAYAIWVVTSLDLTERPPAAVLAVDPAGRFDAEVPAADRPHWIFLHQRFQHVAGPPVDLFLPVDLLPRQGARTDLAITGVTPGLLMDRRKLAPTMSALGKTLLVSLIVAGGGWFARRRLRIYAAPRGRRSAPLWDIPRTPAPDRAELAFLAALLVLATILRLRGFGTMSLDLLEASYLPGIGRPSAFAGRGLGAIPSLVRELAATYCLDLTHPPGYHALMGVMGLLGHSVALLRLPGLLASLTTAVLTWWLLRRWSVAAGLAGVAVFAVSSPAIYFGQDATPYALVGLTALAAPALLERGLRTGEPRAWLAFFAVLVGGFYTHYNVALMGIALLALFGVLAIGGARGGDRRWPAAVHAALGPALQLSPLPLLWLWPHFSTFEPVAQNTRLVADTYAPDPGYFVYLRDFFQVSAGVPADGSRLAAVAALALVTLGCIRAVRRDGAWVLGASLATLTVGFVASVGFFYVNVIEALGGKVFWGFRWVGWAHPVLLAVGVLGAVAGPGPALIRGALFAAWMAGVMPGTVDLWARSPRPDYAGAVDFLRSELQDRDAVATLPAWFQRGNLSHELFQVTRPGRKPDEGEGVWVVDGKRLTVEAIHPSLPFETSALSSHYDRLWVAVVDEQMSGRPKFSPQVAEQALRWADRHLVPDGQWRLDRIDLYRYRVPRTSLELRRGQVLRLSAAETVLNFRTYPQVRGPIDNMRPGSQLTLPEALGPTVHYQAPTTPGCVDWHLEGLPPELQPQATNHWYLELQVPLPDGAPDPEVRADGPAQVYGRRDGNRYRISAAGPPCTEPPLVLNVRWPG